MSEDAKVPVVGHGRMDYDPGAKLPGFRLDGSKSCAGYDPERAARFLRDAPWQTVSKETLDKLEADRDAALAVKANAEAEADRLRGALQGVLDLYVNLVNSGDAGDWDPETVPEVKAARAALSSTPDSAARLARLDRLVKAAEAVTGDVSGASRCGSLLCVTSALVAELGEAVKEVAGDA